MSALRSGKNNLDRKFDLLKKIGVNEVIRKNDLVLKEPI